MKKIFYLLAILISSNSCDTKKNEIKTIDFKTDYKFSSQIKQQVTQDTVPWKYQFSASDYAKKGDYKRSSKSNVKGVRKKGATLRDWFESENWINVATGKPCGD